MRVFLILALLVLSGCESLSGGAGDETPVAEVPEAAPPPATAPQLKTFAFDCESTGYIVVDFRAEADAAWLFLPSTTKRLPRVRAASGERFEDSDILFWTRGREALLDTGEGPENCVENRAASLYEDAKLRGMDFRGQGNEPGWWLEIGPDAILFMTNYGQEFYAFPAEPPVSTDDSSTWTTRADYNSLTVTLSGGPCFDDMSGNEFGTRVVVVLDGRTYRGCGRALH